MSTRTMLSILPLLFLFWGGISGETGTGVAVSQRFSHKFQVSIQRWSENHGLFLHHSSGILFSPARILTSAVELAGVELGVLRVVAGVHVLKDMDSDVRIRTVKEIKFHPNFTTRNPIDYDYAVLALNESLVPSQAIEIIDLPNSEDPSEWTQNCNFTGWHLDLLITDPIDKFTLQQAPMRLMDKYECRKISEANGISVKEYHLCADQLGEIWHQVDLGGPLLCGNNSFVGFGTDPDRGEPGKQPSFFADIRLALEWIRAMEE